MTAASCIAEKQHFRSDTIFGATIGILGGHSLKREGRLPGGLTARPFAGPRAAGLVLVKN